jgi:hypothetical protein
VRPPYFHQIGVLPQCSPFEGEPIIPVIYLYGLLPVCLSAALIKPNFLGVFMPCCLLESYGRKIGYIQAHVEYLVVLTISPNVGDREQEKVV